MKLVLDTNIIVSASLSPAGLRSHVIDAWHNQQFELVVSDPILAEYQQALNYRDVASRHHLNPGQVAEIIANLKQFAIVVQPTETLHIISDDPDDDKFLECALAGGADYIVSADAHLLALEEHRGIQILSAGEFLTLLRQEGEQT
ncbi:MAG: putative toxin-antitoxin system toxin component, PIN family [Dehalococcoidia bacterium]|nr:putative toxin-antitoxin system toxin component, PIN family [Dehalococcoidia bacterium]